MQQQANDYSQSSLLAGTQRGQLLLWALWQQLKLCFRNSLIGHNHNNTHSKECNLNFYFIAIFNKIWTLKFKAQLMIGFSLPSIKIMATAKEPWNTEENKKEWNILITTDRHDLLTQLKWASVSGEVRLDDWQQRKT